MTITLKQLIDNLRPAYTEQRHDGARPIMLAGSVGHVRADMTLHLRLVALHGVAKTAAVDLYDAGCFSAHADGKPFVARLPANDVEKRLFRTALGLAINYATKSKANA